jgi:hypothetical protein
VPKGLIQFDQEHNSFTWTTRTDGRKPSSWSMQKQVTLLHIWVQETFNNHRINFCSYLTSWGCCVQLQTLTCKTLNFLLHCIYSILQKWLINISLRLHHSFALSHLQHSLHIIYILQEQWCSVSLLAALMTISHTNFGLN